MTVCQCFLKELDNDSVVDKKRRIRKDYVPTIIYRQRKCHKCGNKYTTVEQSLEEANRERRTI